MGGPEGSHPRVVRASELYALGDLLVRLAGGWPAADPLGSVGADDVPEPARIRWERALLADVAARFEAAIWVDLTADQRAEYERLRLTGDEDRLSSLLGELCPDLSGLAERTLDVVLETHRAGRSETRAMLVDFDSVDGRVWEAWDVARAQTLSPSIVASVGEGIRLDRAFAAELGLGGLPEADLQGLLRAAYGELELRVGTRLSDALDADQLEEFERLTDAKLDLVLSAWLEVFQPRYREVVADEVARIRRELAQSAATIHEEIARWPA